jgi:predicted Zn-dependent protease
MQEIDTRLIQIEQWLQNVQISAPKTNETNEAHQLIQTASKLLITEAQSVKCLQLFAMRDFEKVKLQIPQLKGLRGELLLELIQSLECYAVRWGKERAIRFQVSQLVLLLINFMDQSENNLNTAQQEILSDLKIEALSQTGQYAQARKLLEEELAANPARSLLAEKLIFMYLENGSPQSLEEAAKLVKKLEAKEKAGTNNWLTYRLLLLETGIKQNKNEETKKLWQVTKVLYPQAGTDEQKKKLLELGDKLKK